MMTNKDDFSGDTISAENLAQSAGLTFDPTSPSLESLVDRFWEAGSELETVEIDIASPDQPLELLEQLGPSPFERGSFPLIGFLATTYDKVSRYALGDG